MRTQANSAVCNFFALLKDDTVRKIDLLQAITNNIKSCFIDNSTKLMDSETEEILFDGNFNIDGNEVLYVEFPLSDTLLEANTNSIGLNTLDISTDEIKSLFWIENNIYYFQNFDKRKLLQNKNVLFWNNSTYDKLSNDALIVENTVNAIYKNGKFYFKSGNYIQSYSITLVKRCKDLLSHIGRIFPYKNVFLSVSLTQQLTNHEL